MKNLLILLSFVLFSSAFGQNLLPNSGFEEVTGCPGPSVYLKNTRHWSRMENHKGTPDQFYGDCTYNGVENPMAPGQKPFDGEGYVGAFAFGDDLREYITAKLTTPMVKDSVYVISFYVLPASGYGTAINSFGAHFSSQPTKGNNTLGTMRYAEHIGNPPDRLIKDTVNWTEISGEYKAMGGEQYITFGNFRQDCNTAAEVIKEKCIRSDRSYMLLDGISLQLKSETDEEQPFYAGRKQVVSGDFKTKEVELTLKIWDHMKMDGDSIFLVLDDSVLLEDYLLTRKKLKMTLSLEEGTHVLQFVAINLGYIPPNTCTIQLSDTVHKKTFILNSDLKESECLRIVVE